MILNTDTLQKSIGTTIDTSYGIGLWEIYARSAKVLYCVFVHRFETRQIDTRTIEFRSYRQTFYIHSETTKLSFKGLQSARN